MDIAISVKNLSKKYRLYDSPQHRLKEALNPFRKKYHHDFWALSDISFDVRRGETIGIIGRNGSGKSTLLQIVAGTLTPTTGEVAVQGRSAGLLELGSGFNPQFTGRENVFMNGAILGIDHSEMEKRFDEIEGFAGIGDFMDQPVRAYSSGMVVRLAFAVSVCVEPDVLIVDEALSVGDIAFQFKCMERLYKLTKSGTTLLFVSHDMGMIKTFCDRVIYLNNGCERASGPPEKMSELYILDMRDEQRQKLAGQSPITVKTFIGNSEGIAFGTKDGRVVKAEFASTGGLTSTFVTGDIIALEAEVEYLESVKNPSLSISVHDRKMLLVYEKHSMISRAQDRNGNCSANLRCSFKAALGAGRYFITVKLDDRPSDNIFFPIDKQVGLLSFEILQPRTVTFQGIADLAMEFANVDLESKGSNP